MNELTFVPDYATRYTNHRLTRRTGSLRVVLVFIQLNEYGAPQVGTIIFGKRVEQFLVMLERV